jgi:anthranilate phosphoribosyltransferase
LDEITMSGPTYVSEVREGTVRSYEVTPEQFGLSRAPIETLTGGDAEANADIIHAILRGEKSPKRDVVVLNAAAALVAAGKADSIRDALALAEISLDKGAATAKLEALVRFSQAQYASG